MMTSFSKKWNKEGVSTELWFNRNFTNLPEFKLQQLDSNVFASYSGPDCGLAFLQNLEDPINDKAGTKRKDESSDEKLVAGCQKWSLKNRKAYGISMSLYDQHPVNGKITGDPIADCFGLCARGNSSLMVVADGVNWGEKSRLAARCAVYGVVKHINEKLFPGGTKDSELDGADEGELLVEDDGTDGRNLGGDVMSSSLAGELGIEEGAEDSKIETTKDLFRLMLKSLESAHKTILRHEGGLTTLCVCLVCPIANPPHPEGHSEDPPTPTETTEPSRPPVKKYVACVVNVGDSLAFVFSRRHGVREITTGSHDVTLERNIRDAGGALGPVTETGEPELNNLTCSVTCVEAGDVIFLATDGITDNFDPVVTKIGVAKKLEVRTPPPANVRMENAFKNEIEQIRDMSEPSKEELLITGEETSSGIDVKEECQDGSKLEADEVAVENLADHSGISSAENPEVSDVTEGNSGVVDHSKLGNLDLNSPSNGNVASISEEFSSSRDEKILKTESDESTNISGNDRHELSESFEIQDAKPSDSPGLENGKPIMLPFERHRYAIKEMERIIHEFELFTECPCSAQELCGALLQHVLKLTDPKRKVLENPDLYGRKKRLKVEERQSRDSEIVQKLAQSPGKLDHATVLGYEVGCYHGNEDEDYCFN